MGRIVTDVCIWKRLIYVGHVDNEVLNVIILKLQYKEYTVFSHVVCAFNIKTLLFRDSIEH